MFCHHCGQKLPEEANFCMKCGTPTTDRLAENTGALVPIPAELARFTGLVREETDSLTVEGEIIDEGATEIPIDEKIHKLLGEAYEHLWEKHDIRGARQLCEQALKLDKNNSEIYLVKGHILSESQQHQEALEAYEQAIKLGNPATADFNVKAEALEYKGKELCRLRRYEEALAALDEGLIPTFVSPRAK